MARVLKALQELCRQGLLVDRLFALVSRSASRKRIILALDFWKLLVAKFRVKELHAASCSALKDSRRRLLAESWFALSAPVGNSAISLKAFAGKRQCRMLLEAFSDWIGLCKRVGSVRRSLAALMNREVRILVSMPLVPLLSKQQQADTVNISRF